MDKAQEIMDTGAYESAVIPTSTFPLFTARPADLRRGGVLNIVIEGDGFAWAHRRRPSDNPTPKDPVGLKIAQSMTPQALYLARPCQYVMPPSCGPAYWTDRRFDAQVIRAFHEVLDSLKKQYGAVSFNLAGYSGGAYIAFVLAAERRDIGQVTTVAGLLDPEGWARHHNITPIRTDYNLQTLLEKTSATRFVHYCGRDDEVVPCALTAAATDHLPNHSLKNVPGTDHETVWEAL